MGPLNTPADDVGMLVMNIGTVVSQVMWRISMPAFMSAVSKEKLAAQKEGYEVVAPELAEMSVTSAVSSPCSYTR